MLAVRWRCYGEDEESAAEEERRHQGALKHVPISASSPLFGWFKGQFGFRKITQEMGKSMVSGEGFPLNQSIDLLVGKITQKKS